MYDEIERAVGGAPRRGKSVLGWIAVAFVGFTLLGVGGVVMGLLAVRNQAREVVERFERVERDGRTLVERGMSDAMAGAVAGALARIDPDVLGDDPEVGRSLLRTLQSGELDAAELQDLVQGSLRIRTDEGDVTADLRGGEEGGVLQIRSPDGEATLELTRSEEGGVLVIRTDGETLRLGAGSAADGVPAWVPRAAAMPDGPEHVVSASSGRGSFGSVTWDAEGSPEALVDAYRERLEEEGYTLRAEHAARAGRSRTASVMGRDEDAGRLVFLVASREGDATRVVLGYGEERGP